MSLTSRQIHLDFHTSADIDAIGRDFDPEQFAQTLKEANVTSINCFARGHHGHIYYDTKLNPERLHPHSERKHLLPEQIEACHKLGIKVPIYITVQWDLFTAEAHPEWLLRDELGKPYGNPLFHDFHGFYDRLDVSHPGYIAFLKAHVKEIFETMPVDGLWWDIVVPYFSYEKPWRDRMDAAGLDITNEAHRTQMARQSIVDFEHTMTDFVKGLPQYQKDCLIFYNSGHVGVRHSKSADAYTHFELESLPGGGWGYMHFPVAQRYARGLGKPTLGMTGKFHSSWGDFHGYKNEASLQFEIFNMLALAADATNIGDQLPPNGVLDEETYKLIGGVFASVEEKEPWCQGAKAVCDVAVMHPEEFQLSEGVFHGQEEEIKGRTDFGVVRMLQELGQQFDMIDSTRDFSAYRLIVLPDKIPVDEALAKKFEAFVAGGGSLILTHKSGLTPTGDAFATDLFGVEYVGDAEFCPDFLRPEPALREGLADTKYVMAQRAVEVKPLSGGDVLAKTERPYFNRKWNQFCSHQYAPSSGEFVYPSAVRKGQVVYFAHPLFQMYDYEACRWPKRLVRNAIQQLLGHTMVEHNGPSTLIVTVNEQAHESRYAMHLQHYIPERRGDAFDTVEDIIPLHDLGLTLRTPRKIASAMLVPTGTPLALQNDGDAVTLTVPKLEGHQIIELSYA